MRRLAVFFLMSGVLWAQELTFSGHLSVVFGDPEAGSEGMEPAPEWTLFEESYQVVFPLAMDEDLVTANGGATALQGRYVRVRGVLGQDRQGGMIVFADSLMVRDPERSRDVTGSHPWVSLMLKFSDVASEPEDLAFFSGMYDNSAGRLDHHWREQSYGKANIQGSTAHGWRSLPQNHTYYVPTPGSGTGADLDGLFDDGIDVFDPFVDFTNGGTGGYSGINLMFNERLDCCAWGGGKWATIDGVSKVWRVTWEPPWGWADAGVIAHEMGHGFGLPHSNNWDNDTNPYDNRWDVMSAAQSRTVVDPTYGRLGKHTCGYHKDELGWFDPDEVLRIDSDGTYSVTVDHLALADTENLRYVTVEVSQSPQVFYAIECRKRAGNYDANLAGDCILIYEVMPSRGEPAWAVDAALPPADFNDNEGTMWKVGETFQDATHGISITVDSATTDGFNITVQVGDCDPMTQLHDAIEGWPFPETVLTLLDAMTCP